MICPRCGSENVNVQVVTETQRKTRWCLGCFFWWIAFLFPKQKDVTHTEGVCQSCGNRFRLENNRYDEQSHIAPSYSSAPSYTISDSAPAKKSISSPVIAALPGGKSVADELEKYADLLGKGAITQEEFNLIKSSLLGTEHYEPTAIKPVEQIPALPEPCNEQVEINATSSTEDKNETFAEKVKAAVVYEVKSLLNSFKARGKGNTTKHLDFDENDIALRFSPAKRAGFRIAFYVFAVLTLFTFISMCSDSSMSLLFCLYLGATAFCLLQSMMHKKQQYFSIKQKTYRHPKHTLSCMIWGAAVLLFFILIFVLPESQNAANVSASDIASATDISAVITIDDI